MKWLSSRKRMALVGIAVLLLSGYTFADELEDRLIEAREQLDAEMNVIEFVDGSRVLTDGKRSVEIHDIGPTPHSEHILLVYLPDSGIVFQADHMAVPRTGPMAPAITNTRAMAKAMKARGISMSKMVSAHSPRVIGASDLDEALALETKLASN